MDLHPFSRRFLVTQWVIAASCSLFTCFLLLFHKATPEQSFYSGISFFRLLAITLPFSVFTIALYSIRQSLAKTTDSNHIIDYIFNRPSRMAMVQVYAAIAISIGLLGMFLPAYHFEPYAAYYARTQPLIIWVGILGLQLLILILFPRRTQIYKQLYESLMENRGILQLSFWIFLSFILLWTFIANTGMGISGNEDYWYEAGVPILPVQILISLLAGLLFGLAEKFLIADYPLKLDSRIFLGIWLITAFFWGITPAPHSYFNPSSLPPNHEVYPYSDAAKYDLQSQYVLIGQGLNNGKSVDNPLYPLFLVFIHLVSGQNYMANMALQAAIFAVFPALAYLIGKTLFGRTLGITAALLIAFRGYNSIVAASLINLASPKQMLTDFPTAIGVALSIFTLIMWIDKGRENPAHAIWHGGAIGFTFLIRPTALVLLAIAPIIALIQRFPHGKWLRIVFLTLIGFVVFVTPWGFRNNAIRQGSAINVYLQKINLVKEKRFPEVQENNLNRPSDSPLEQLQVNAENLTNPQQAQYDTVLKIISSHFIHNLIGSTLILPSSPMFDDLHHALISPNTFWLPFWDGDLVFGQIITLLISLAALAIGIAGSWRRNQLIGLIPLMAFLFYQLANSIGRTSGGRYIVPVDWIIIFYFAVGLIEVCGIIFQPPMAKTINPVAKTSSSAKSMTTVLSLVLFLGAIPLLIELPFPARPAPIGKEDSPVSPNFQGIISQSNYSEKDISNFLKEENSILLTGQAMYPRYFNYRTTTRYTEGGLIRVEFPRLEFSLIGPKGTQAIVLYKQTPVQLPNNTNILVLGCKQKDLNYVDAIAIIVSAPANITHFRQSNPPLECPLQQPKCDNNGNCN